MKCLYLILCSITIAACADQTSSPTKLSEDSSQVALAAAYTNNFQIGNPKLAKIALDFYKYFDSNKVKKFSENISDSIKMNLSDGYECDCSRDSAIQVINHFRSSFQRIQTIPDAFVTVTFKGQPGTWVSIWGKRIATEGGRSDTLFFNDNWKFDQHERIVLRNEYTRKSAR